MSEEQSVEGITGEDKDIKDIRIRYQNGDSIDIEKEDILSGFYSFLVERDGNIMTFEGSNGKESFLLMQFGRLLNLSRMGEIMYYIGNIVAQDRGLIDGQQNDQEDNDGKE